MALSRYTIFSYSSEQGNVIENLTEGSELVDFIFVLGVRFHIVITKGQAPREGGYMARGVIFFLF